MSKGRSDMAAERRPGEDPERWLEPVALAHVDLDALPGGDLRLDRDAPRAWVVASRGGHVLGAAELPADHGVVPASALEALRSTLRDPGARDVDAVALERLPTATVVVCTIGGRPAQLVEVVSSLLELEHPSFDVVVVDNRSRARDDALPALPGGPRVRVVREPRRGISAARNRGIAEATGEIVAFTDDDVVVDPRWLRYLCARFVVEPEVEALGGLVLPMELETEPQLWFEEFYGGFSQSYAPRSWSMARSAQDDPLFPYAAGRYGAGCNMAFRRTALERLGGFDEALGAGTPARGGEDLAMYVSFLLAGATIGFEPAAIVRHTHRRTRHAFFRQVRDYGVGLTAMYASLVARDRRHLGELLRRIPVGLRLLVRPRDERSPSQSPSYPRRTLLLQVAGMARGPFAYARSRRERST